jgi:VIT1/CCC1 family predicted Fe2+/Mn2+ transporter
MARRAVHRSDLAGWLRAAVLGANDGIVSTASLVLGVAAATASSSVVLVAGVSDRRRPVSMSSRTIAVSRRAVKSFPRTPSVAGAAGRR